jgi:hypothetical protein
MTAEMRARGWEVEENISEKHLLAYEYQEQMAIKDHLFGQRILPRIGDLRAMYRQPSFFRTTMNRSGRPCDGRPSSPMPSARRMITAWPGVGLRAGGGVAEGLT